MSKVAGPWPQVTVLQYKAMGPMSKDFCPSYKATVPWSKITGIGAWSLLLCPMTLDPGKITLDWQMEPIIPELYGVNDCFCFVSDSLVAEYSSADSYTRLEGYFPLQKRL